MQHLAFAFDAAPPPERPAIVCAGCGIERGDLYADSTITVDAVSGREVFDGPDWRTESRAWRLAGEDDTPSVALILAQPI